MRALVQYTRLTNYVMLQQINDQRDLTHDKWGARIFALAISNFNAIIVVK